MNHSPKTNAGVQFDADVLEFLDVLRIDFDRSRSFLVNDIVRAYSHLYREQATRPLSKVIEA
jgi:hypothetical protein